jgi:hypothetical protein
MSKIIPNSFPTPNAHVDQSMYYLTGDQYKVLNYAVRHVYGWHNRPERYQGRISLSVFVDGFTTEDGQRYLGCGLGRNIVVQILDTLVSFGLLAKAGEPTVDGQKWGIGMNPNWDLIIDEYKKREAPNQARVLKMNAARARKREEKARLEGVVSSHDTSTSDDTGKLSSHDTGERSSDDTHINTSSSHAKDISFAPAIASGGGDDLSHTHNGQDASQVSGDWPEGIAVTYPDSKTISARAEKVMSPASSPSPSLKPTSSTAEDTTAPIPNSAAPLSPSIEQVSPESAVARVNTGKTETPKTPAVTVESDKQKAQRIKVEALVACGFVMPVSSRSWSNFKGVLKTLTEVGMTHDMYADFVKWVKGLSASSGNWTVTLNSLAEKNRPEMYMAQKRPKKATVSDSMPYQVSTTPATAYTRYDPDSDAAYAPRGEKAQ